MLWRSWRERPNVVHQLPPRFFGKRFEAGHWTSAFCDLPIKLAIGDGCHCARIAKIRRRNGQLLGLRSFSITIYAVAIRTAVLVNESCRCKGLRRGRNGIPQLSRASPRSKTRKRIQHDSTCDRDDQERY